MSDISGQKMETHVLKEITRWKINGLKIISKKFGVKIIPQNLTDKKLPPKI